MDFSLIETFGWWPGSGFRRLDRHLARLRRSAEHFGWRMNAEKIKEKLDCHSTGDRPLRFRVLYSSEGVDEITAAPFEPLAGDACWKIRISDVAIDLRDELLRHKTTRRAVYEASRNQYSSAEADEVILLNGRGEVCEGTITNVFLREVPRGPLLTPALECGLLPGILREEALETGIVVEKKLTLDDLRNACELYAGNSLRGFVRAKLTG